MPHTDAERPAPLSSLRVLALLCILVPVIVYASVGAVRYRQIHTETQVRLDRSLRIAQEHALKVFDISEAVLARLLDAVGTDAPETIRRREADLHQQLQQIAANKPQIHSLWVQDAQGHPVVSNRYFPAPSQISAADRDYFVWHREKRGGTYVSAPMLGRATGSAFFDMSRGRYLPDGSFNGLVSISLAPSYFENFHSDLVADEPGMAVTMLRSDGTILSRWPVVHNAPARLAPDSPVMSRIAQGAREGQVEGISSVDQRTRLLAFRKVGDFPVYVGTGMDLSEVRNRWLDEMAWLAAFGLPPMIGLFIAGRLALRRAQEALDAAERLKLETLARRRVEEALLQAQKLEALGRLTGGVAHDFNNALMVISNNLYLLKKKHPEADGPQADSIARAIESATKLTRQLPAFSRRQALVPEYTNLHQRLPRLEGLLGPVLGSLIRLSTTVAADTAPIFVDAAELELALINLAINARDAMPKGGDVRLGAYNAGPSLPAGLRGRFVVIEVSDTGSGIAADVLDKVFEPFFTTKPVGEGTGLGLSQVYGLCQRAGGLATIGSEPGQGTTVALYFPASGELPTELAPPAAPAAALGVHKSVLLVEDNDAVAAGLQQVLTALGCRVTRVDRAQAALDWLATQRPLPDVLLSDVVMPGPLDGLALARQVRTRHAGIDILLMTGHAAQLNAISAEGFEVLPKPCSAETLAQALARGRPG